MVNLIGGSYGLWKVGDEILMVLFGIKSWDVLYLVRI